MTRGGKMTQEPLYPGGHPKRVEQDSQRINTDAPSPPSNKKKRKTDRTLHASSEPVIDTPENPNDISISDAETQHGDEHEPSTNVNNDVHVDAQPSNDNDVEVELDVDLDNPTQVVEVNSLYRFHEGDIPHNKSASQCLHEFDNFIVKQENFNAYVSRQLKCNAYMLDHWGDYMSRTVNDLKLISKHASMVKTQVEQVLRAQNDFLNEMNNKMNDHVVRVTTRGEKMTQ